MKVLAAISQWQPDRNGAKDNGLIENGYF